MAQRSSPNQQDMEVDLRRQLNDVFGEFDRFADLVPRQLFGVIPTPGVMRGLTPYSTNRLPSNASIPSASLCLQEMKNVPPLIPPLHVNRNENQNAGCASEASSSNSHMNDVENYNGRKKRKRDRSEEDSDGPLKRREKKEDNKMMRDLFDDDIDDEKGDWKGSGCNNTPPPEIRMMVLGMQVDPLIPPYDTNIIKKKDDDDEREKEDRERKRKREREDSERRRKEKNDEEERKKKRDEDEERKRKKDDEEDRRRRRDDEERKRRKDEDDKRRKRGDEEKEKERKRKDDEERDREAKRKELDEKRKRKEELEKEEEERRIQKEKKKLEKEERKRKEEEEKMKEEERERKKKEKDEEKRRFEEEEEIKREKENREREELARRIEEDKKRELERIRQEEEDKKKELERIRKDEMRNREVEEKRKRDEDERKKKEDEDRLRKDKKKEEEKRRSKEDEKEKKKKDDPDRGKKDKEKKGSLLLNSLSNSKLEAVLEAEKDRRKREKVMSESKDERISLWNDSKKKNWKDENGKDKKRKDTERIMKKEGSSALSSPMSSKNSSRVVTPIPPLSQPTSTHQNVCSPSSSVHLFSFPNCPSSSCLAARLVPHSPVSLEQRPDKEGYTNYAKEKKHCGDASTDRNVRFFYYLESSMYFALSVSSCLPSKSSDRELSIAGSVLKDTVDLIKYAMVLFEKEGIGHLLSRAKILCIRTQAVLNYHMYFVRSKKFPHRAVNLASLESQVQEIPRASPKKEERNSMEKGDKNIGPSSSSNSSSNMVTMPMSLWKMKSSQVSTFTHLENAHILWNESNNLMSSNEKHYWNTIDNLILHSFDWGCPLHVGSSLLHLCTFINTTVSWMRMEYEAEKGK